MKTAQRDQENLSAILNDLASRIIGFQRDSFRIGAVEKVIREKIAEGISPEELARQAAQGEPELLARLYEAVPVGETYFFRQPAHFHYLESEVLSRPPKQPLKIWSAGCATGEETYSLAGCLMESGLPFEILGTDLSKKHLEKAREGIYSTWSLRGPKEILYPIFKKPVQPPYRVNPQIKNITQFQQHNLLTPLPDRAGHFDVIFCRNVLVYFTPAAARQAIKNFWRALAPEGLLFLGPTDILFPPAGFVSQGPSKFSIFKKSTAQKSKSSAMAPKKAAPQKPDLIPSPLSSRPKPGVSGKGKEKTDPIGLHLAVLETMEGEKHKEVDRLLKQLGRQFPDYLPGLYENALWNARKKNMAAAKGCMTDLLNRLGGRPPQEVIPGPLELTVHYYRASAQTFLAREES